MTMRRRHLVCLLGSVPTAWTFGVTGTVAPLSIPLPAASQDKVWRVGLLSAGVRGPVPGAHSTWRDGVLLSLEQNGFRIGRNLEMVDRYADGNIDLLPSFSREIAAANV